MPSRHHKAYIIIAIIVLVIILTIYFSIKWGTVWIWNILGESRTYFPDLANLVLALVGVLYAMNPKKAAEAERKHSHRLWGAVLIIVGVCGFIWGYIDKGTNDRNMHDLYNRSKIQATTQDINNLRSDIKSGFERVVSSINSLANSLQTVNKISKVKPSPEEPRPISPPPAQDKITLGPALVGHIQFSQGRTISNRDDAPYALQVTLQTDVSTQPTAFMIETNGDITDGRFFLVGQAVMMNIRYGVQADKRHFYLSFAYPAFTPESPIVITLLSKTDIRVIGVNKAN